MQTTQRKSFPASPLKRARTNKSPGTKPNLATPIILRIAALLQTSVSHAKKVTCLTEKAAMFELLVLHTNWPAKFYCVAHTRKVHIISRSRSWPHVC